jgi:hypothetical protein
LIRARNVVPPVGVGAFAVICCAGLPAVPAVPAMLALAGGATVPGLLGGGVAFVLLAGDVGVFVVRARRRRVCAVAPSRPRRGA